MLGTLIVVLGIVALGSAVGDRMRIKQEEVILKMLSVPEAAAFYESLVRRVRKTRWLRATSLAAVWVLIYLWKRNFLGVR